MKNPTVIESTAPKIEMSSKSILILGSSGYVGGSMAEHLTHKGMNVTTSSRSEGCDYKFTEYTNDPIPSTTDVIVAAIGSTEQDGHSFKQSAISSIETICNLIDLHKSGELKSPIIYFSTFHVYGKYTGKINESSETKPKNIYSLVHKQAEELLKLYSDLTGTKVVILRPTNIYGTVNHEEQKKRLNLIPMCFIVEARETGTIIIKAKQKTSRDYIHIRDVGRALEKLISNIEKLSRWSVFNICSGQSYEIGKVAEMVKTTYKEMGRDICINRNINSEEQSMKDEELVVENKCTTILSGSSRIEESLASQIARIIHSIESSHKGGHK